MNISYTRTFKDPHLLEEMLELRKQGWSITALADRYGCNFTSVWHQCRKYHIVPVKVVVKLTKEPKPRTYVDFDGTIVNRGKSYRAYLKEEEKRRQARIAVMQITVSHTEV